MSLKLGVNGKMYWLNTGTRASWGGLTGNIYVHAAPANLSEITLVKDVTLGLEKDEADVTTRGSGGWEAVTGTLKKAPIEFSVLYDPTDATWQALRNSWLNSTPVAIAALDGGQATLNVEGLWADFEVISFKKGEQLKDAQTTAVTMKPTYSTVPPQWVKVSA